MLNLTQSKEQARLVLFVLTGIVVAYLMFYTPDVLAQTNNTLTGTTQQIIMTRSQIKTAGGGIDALFANVTGGLGTTGLRVMYSSSYFFGTLFMFLGIIGLKNQFKQDESQRKFVAPVSGILLGVALAGFTTIFGLMSDTYGFGAAIGRGLNEDMKLENAKSGMGLGETKANDSQERWAGQ